ERKGLCRRSGPGGHLVNQGPPGGSGPQIRITQEQKPSTNRPRRSGPGDHPKRQSPGGPGHASPSKSQCPQKGQHPQKGEPPERSKSGPPFALGVHPYRSGGGRAGFFVLDLSTSNHTSPFHIPTDIVVVCISHAGYNVAEHTKSKCTFDLKNHGVQVFAHTIGP